ncbi:NADP-dependent 3-hydroxy acid dehydrogenase YdfG [Flavobacterium sp. 90]|uniref:SDR family oxidoreductase n=1 Tax=unclassified Flavobacterium TaxID=196869 RepID=UPI000EB18D28|nr:MULTISPECIES: SDR family oxidoreductase [unclassified Flavobacterium]RKR05602.1 NADP-dependent 3-hydroxy acid dehydrogenase YdfG [Flavobacterium sp. 81]TCK56918.1 NADP-dependent 3-hydroxy acid dehydrogenase YdfG [Flavobacterium sp. 90]
MKKLIEKVVVITGASSGIGKAIALKLAEHGAKVVLGARNKDKLAELADEIEKTAGEVKYVVIDVKKKEDLDVLIHTAVSFYGRLDVLINNAGMSELSRIDDLDIDGWEEMIDVNIKGVLYGIAAAIPVFKQQKSGHIINIISTSGIKIVPMQGVYAGTKNAVRTITEAFRQESNGEIRITGISPGFVKTDFAENIKNDVMKSVIKENMEKMAISPNAVANAVLYAIEQPADVEIGDIVIRPAVQN